MSKSSGARSGVTGRNTAGIVDVVQRRQADRLAKVAFIVTACILIPSLTVIASPALGVLSAALLGIVTGVVTALVVGLVVLIWPILRVLWWWTAEIMVLAVILGGYLLLTTVVPWPVALAVVAVAVVVPFVVPASRRWLLAWIWCGISRHRLRTCFATFIRVNRFGSIPLITVARPTPAGDRVWVLLRPGLALEDLTTEGQLTRLAVGCWASQVRLSRAFPRFAPLVRVDITRRSPLSGVITNPLPHLFGLGNKTTPTTTAPDAAGDRHGLDLDDVPEDTTTTPVVSMNRPRPSPRPKPAPTEATPKPATTAATGGGTDLDEWI